MMRCRRQKGLCLGRVWLAERAMNAVGSEAALAFLA